MALRQAQGDNSIVGTTGTLRVVGSNLQDLGHHSKNNRLEEKMLLRIVGNQVVDIVVFQKVLVGQEIQPYYR